jgi:hypothetical protein
MADMTANRWGKFHRTLFAWHCRMFHPFETALRRSELAFLEQCFSLCESDAEVEARGYGHLSFYSYSHRIHGDAVNSSRLAWGTVLYPDKLRDSARQVVVDRGLDVAPYFFESSNSLFYGLGWDLAEQQFKVYFRVPDMLRLPQAELRALAARARARTGGAGLVSFTFVAGALHESKVYLYPSPRSRATTHRTLMVTDRRGVVPQDDIVGHEKHAAWVRRLSSPGRAIVQRYQSIGLTADTVAFEDRDRYTLYFP